ncbi:MAG: TonB-dependent receptor plug domain-containing protein [Roseateles sp.]
MSVTVLMKPLTLRAVPAACVTLSSLLVLGLSLSSGGALAQDMPPGMGDTPQRQPNSRLERVDISARQSDTDLRRKSQVAKQIYGREEMDKYGDTNVSDVLKRLPGVTVQGGGPRMRGLGAGYTLILINGDPAPPGFALDQLSPSQVERIEVTKGPTADQSAQAVAGAINIILKDAPRVSQRDLRLGAGYNAVRPTPSATFTYGERIGNVSLSVPLSAFEWRGQNQFTTDRVLLATDKSRQTYSREGEQDNWGHGFNTAPRLNWRISDEESLAVQAFVQKGYWNNRQTFNKIDALNLPFADDDSLNQGTWQNVRGNAQWTNRFSDSQRVELKLTLQESKGTFDNLSFREPKPGAGQQPFRSTVGNNQDQSLIQGGKYAQLLGDEHSLTVGWDLEWRKRDELRTQTQNGQILQPKYDNQVFSANIERQALFVQDEWELSPQWSTYLGLRGERIKSSSRGTEQQFSNVSTVVTPLWHLNYKLDPKGRDLIRASLTRSYKAPDLNALLARPLTNSVKPVFGPDGVTPLPNDELNPDRAGNPNLKPELATGLDIAFEKYLSGGGMASVGVFYRSINDLIRNRVALETVDWSSLQRYVSRPVNFSKAQTMGLELEVKGRAGELLPSVFDPKLALNLRGNLSIYRSNVDALPMANNRLDGQQPWSANVGFDYRLSSLPLSTGLSLAYTPGYATQQTLSQSLDLSNTRALDVYAQWVFSKSASLRFSANNLAPLDSRSLTLISDGGSTQVLREGRTQFGLALELKL